MKMGACCAIAIINSTTLNPTTMAFPTAVNSQITDAVTQANVKVLGDAPAMAMSDLYQATAQALSNAAHNATSAQQQSIIMAQTATTMGVATLYAIDTATTGVATKTILSGAAPNATGTQGEAAKVAIKEVNAANVEGHIHSRLYSAAGKADLQRAVAQANEQPTIANDSPPCVEATQQITDAIAAAMKAGVSKQGVCATLHQVAHDQGITMLYPFDVEGEVTQRHIESYYAAIIAAGNAES